MPKKSCWRKERKKKKLEAEREKRDENYLRLKIFNSLNYY